MNEEPPAVANPQSAFPINRIIAFGGPYIAIVSGALADWLLVHVHLLGIFHTTKSSIASFLTQAIVFALTAIIVWAGHQKWLTGWQLFENTSATTPAPEYVNGPEVDTVATEDMGDYDPATAGGKSPPVSSSPAASPASPTGTDT